MRSLNRHFRRQFLLFRVAGILVKIESRWFAAAAVLSLVAASSINALAKDLSFSLVLGTAATLLFFLSVFVHEAAHAFAARFERLEVVEIVLHPFGGLTRFRHEPATARAEFRIAIAGPAASFAVAVAFLLPAVAARAAGVDILALILFLLALSNFLLAVFNMLPGYPLDGGRVLRAYLWKSGRQLDEATIATGRSGQFIAVGIGLAGIIIVIVRADFFTGFWAMLVGLFLFDAARGIISDVQKTRARTVEELMRPPIAVSPNASIEEVIDSVVTLSRGEIYPVAADRKLYGTLTLADIKPLDRARWRETSVADVMRPIEPEHVIVAGNSLAEALALLDRAHLDGMAVVDKTGRLIGFITRAVLLSNVRR